MRLSHAVLALSIAACVPLGATLAQDQAVETASEDQLPAEVRNALSTATRVTEVLSVDGSYKFSGQILKVDEIVLQRDAEVEFLSMDFPWVALIAKRIRIVEPTQMRVFRRNTAANSGAPAASGKAGKNGKDGGREGRHGTDGKNGGNGEDGANGTTAHSPTLYFVAGQIEASTSPTALSSAALTFDFTGPNGGDGGAGGRGGRGGAGGNGKGSSSGAFDCKRGPGKGGDGGNGANGGNGGNGAPGGNGSTIVFISSQQGVDLLSSSLIRNDGGKPGQAGEAGAAGEQGSDGEGGSRKGYCQSGGEDGDYGKPGKAGASGQPGHAAGARGKIQTIVPADMTTLL